MTKGEEDEYLNNEIINANDINKRLCDERKKNIVKFKFEFEEDSEIEGSGFLCKININNNPMPVLITCNHCINSDNYLNRYQYLHISYFLGKEKFHSFLDLKSKRIIYENKDIDITIVEIKEEDNLDLFSFLENDNDINLNNPQLNDRKVYLLHYPFKKEDVHYSQGIIKYIRDNKYQFISKYSTELGSSGSPIIDYKTNLIIGMHQEGSKGYICLGSGIILKYAIEIFIKKKYNEIKLLYKNLYSSDTIDLTYKVPNNSDEIRILGDRFVSRYKYLCSIIYNGIEYNHLFKYLKLSDEDKLKTEIKITLKGINNSIKNVSHMFGFCEELKKVNASKIDTSHIINMEAMFEWCTNLEEISDVSRWNVENVTSMKGMFYKCKKLKSVPGIEKWNPLKLTDCRELFLGCEKIPLSEVAKIENGKNFSPMQIEQAKKGLYSKSLLGYMVFENAKESIDNVKKFIKKIKTNK